MTTAIAFISVLGLLIFIHELGHFLAAKWAGIRVERFSLGFPPRMIGKKIGETDYCISWIPLGGYVKMSGMIDESMDAKIEGKPYEFMSKPIWKRAIVIAAGPLMNVLLAVVSFAGLTYYFGIAEPVPIIREVLEDRPAAQAGLQKASGAQAMVNHLQNSPLQSLPVQGKQPQDDKSQMGNAGIGHQLFHVFLSHGHHPPVNNPHQG